ncbi:MAG: hypothetical protein RQ833_11850 [Sphingomonadaceae bacterium]|nr:hypothetical protein [Sphingomonadaceae bacterium]
MRAEQARVFGFEVQPRAFEHRPLRQPDDVARGGHRYRADNPARNPAPAEIRAAREAPGLTQEQAAAMVFSARRAWQDWEAGALRMHPAIWELLRIKAPARAED